MLPLACRACSSKARGDQRKRDTLTKDVYEWLHQHGCRWVLCASPQAGVSVEFERFACTPRDTAPDSTRRKWNRLVRELRDQGVPHKEQDVFVARPPKPGNDKGEWARAKAFRMTPETRAWLKPRIEELDRRAADRD